jgi:uncharacterized repeat protein (TIGR03803 family)
MVEHERLGQFTGVAMKLANFANVLLGCACAAIALAPACGAQAKTFKVIYTFCAQTNCSDGGAPYGGLILDDKGNLYGTTSINGNLKCNSPAGCGTIFELSAQGTLKGLHSFKTGQGRESLSNLVADNKGNLYGSLTYGGDDSGCDEAGCGTVYKLAADGTEKTLYVFTGQSDGGNPFGSPIIDSQGNVYGTTNGGGLAACGGGCGTVYKVTPSGKETVLYNFCSDIQNSICLDGVFPQGSVIADKAGNLYGTTFGGGSLNWGTVFELAPDGTETVLYSFKGGADGGVPEAGLIADDKGNLYGTTTVGGSAGYGTVFKVAPDGTETILHSFAGGSDGNYPMASLVEDKKGNLYGTTTLGGGSGCINNDGCGTVFEVTQSGTEKILHSFGDGSSGFYTYGSLVADGQGNIYGTTVFGGSTQWGTVFTLKE